MSATKKMWIRRFMSLDGSAIKWVFNHILNAIGWVIFQFFDNLIAIIVVLFIGVMIITAIDEGANERLKKQVATTEQIAELRKDPKLTTCVDHRLTRMLAFKDFKFVSEYHLRMISEECKELAARNINGTLEQTSAQQVEDIKKMIGTQP